MTTNIENVKSDMDLLKNYIEDSLPILHNLGNVNKEKIGMTIVMMVNYHNYLQEKEVKSNTHKLRYWILGNYNKEVDNTNRNIFRMFLFHLVNKYPTIRNITTTIENKQMIDSLIDSYSKKIIFPENIKSINIKYTDGLTQTDMISILTLRNKDEKFIISNEKISFLYKDVFSIAKETLKVMDDLEEKCVDKYGLFRVSVDGGSCSHCNLLFFDYKIKVWFRIEPCGFYFLNKLNNFIGGETAISQYGGLDQIIKAMKDNYFSHNDYYFLPGLHTFNPGPYCVFYSIMIVDEYTENDDSDINKDNKLMKMINTIEKISRIDYIETKLKEYEHIVDLFND